MEILKKSLTQLKVHISKGEISCEAVTSQFLQQTKKLNPGINAFITINDGALEKAHELDRRHKKGETLGELSGLPIAIKDLICTRGLKTTAASKALSNFIPPYSSTVFRKLDEADAINIGKTNLDEFAMGSSNETSFYGPCKNPWNKDYVPGGSSGGSAAAVAGFMAPASVGTDTGGSIRQPASFCGVVGLKPTYGRVSRYGIVAFASSLDQAGPITKNVKDAALLAKVLCGRDKMDSTTSYNEVPNWLEGLNSDMSKVVIGLPKEYFNSDMIDNDVRSRINETIVLLKSKGARFKDVSLPSLSTSISVYYLICTSEASSNLSRYDGVRYGHRANFSKRKAENILEFYSRTRGEAFGEEVKRRIITGTFALSSGYYEAYYLKACRVRRVLQDEYVKALSECDVLLSPVVSSTAFKLGVKDENPLNTYNNDLFTTAANLVGAPALSVPIGFGENKMPIGVQLMGRAYDEQSILNVGQAIEEGLKIKEHANVV